METYAQKLEKWYQTECNEGRMVDIKMTCVTNEEVESELGRKLTDAEKAARVEATCKAVYETVTGKRKTRLILDGERL